jgi:dTDP-4-dehydrorhamnose reductase
VVRTALVFGTSRPTFIHRVARSLATNETVTAATDIVNSPTFSKDLAAALSFLIEKHVYGIYHIVNEGFCTRFELSKFIAESLGKKGNSIRKGFRSQLKLKAKRPGYTPLENFAWNLNGFPKMRAWQDAVVSYLEELPE